MTHVDLRPQHLNFISLCTGGGGLDLGVELAIPGARAVCLVEREAFACAHLVAAMEAGRLAPAPLWGNARTFKGRSYRGCVDGVIGGIPCQPHSVAGKRLGRDDERDLWSVARRILVQSGAWWVFVENVEGMLSSGGAERVWRDLGRLGFAVEGGLFTAAEVGAPHGRARVFILGVADARNVGQRREGLADHPAACVPPQGGHQLVDAGRGGRSGRPQEPVQGQVERASAEWPGRGPVFPPGPEDLDGWQRLLDLRPDLKPAVRGGSNGLANRVDRLRMLGNGVVPLQAAYALRTLSTRLAAAGSSGAAELVRLMGDA